MSVVRKARPKPTAMQKIIIKAPKPKHETESWWIGLGREEFQREAVRRHQDGGSGRIPIILKES